MQSTWRSCSPTLRWDASRTGTRSSSSKPDAPRACESPHDSSPFPGCSLESDSQAHESELETMATSATPPTKVAKPPPVGPARPIRKLVPNGPPLLRFYRSSVGKKWVMAVTGVMLMGFVVFHLIGNLKLYLSKEEINLYGEALRDMPGHLLPRTVLLWTLRSGLFVAFVLHLPPAYG